MNRENKRKTFEKGYYKTHACNEVFTCRNCAHVYDKKRLLVEKHSQSVSMDVGQKKAYLNGDEVDISSALKEVRGQLVVSLEDLSNLLGYSCSFDIASNTITASDKDTSAIVPASYDLRERDRVSTIYNQGSYGTCWAFAATSALESSLRPEEKVNFSVDHMSMSNSFHANQYDGGEYTMGMAYLAAWQGLKQMENAQWTLAFLVPAEYVAVNTQKLVNIVI